jgi:hypothetical protein
MIYRGRAEWRQERGPMDGRADIVHAERAAGRDVASIAVDRIAKIAARAASS